jgi:hypothetical protein
MTVRSKKEIPMNASAETVRLTLNCPKCHGEMLVYERQGIVVDQCRDCRGVWLDRGELDHLIDLEARLARDTGRLEGATRGMGASAWDAPAGRDDRGRGDERGSGAVDPGRRSWDDDDPDDDRRYGGRRRGGLFGELFEGILE